MLFDPPEFLCLFDSLSVTLPPHFLLDDIIRKYPDEKKRYV